MPALVKSYPLLDCPGIDLVPECFSHFMLVDGKSGKGDIMPALTVGIVYPVYSGGYGGHFYGHYNRIAGYTSLRVGNDNGVVSFIRTGGILQG